MTCSLYFHQQFLEWIIMISAKVIANSISLEGVRIVTFELEYPRFIHSEFMTHRQFSRNAASSRAIPVNVMADLIINNPATPVHWGKNQPGMQAKEELVEPALIRVKSLWNEAKDEAIRIALSMNLEQAHKQIINRILEPFQHIKVVMTATCLDNFFYLRSHTDAQPEIKVLSDLMVKALDESVEVYLNEDDWHLPYYGRGYWAVDDEGTESQPESLEDAIAISASCCAQVSYRKADTSLEKALDIYRRLVDFKPVHASPFEHQATPFNHVVESLEDILPHNWPKGVTHMDKEFMFWSGNFKGWIQNRQLIEGHVYTGKE
jgi:hypothetical protein